MGQGPANTVTPAQVDRHTMNMAINPAQMGAASAAKPAPGSIIFDKVSVVFEATKLTAVSEFSLNIATHNTWAKILVRRFVLGRTYL